MSEKYFLGAMTQNGFSTEFGKIMADKEYFTFILKGGAGTGKSSLMKKIAAEFEPTEDVTRFYCSSDPASLDAIVLHTSKAIICDGTAPRYGMFISRSLSENNQLRRVLGRRKAESLQI